MTSIIKISTWLLLIVVTPVCAQQKTASERFSIHDLNRDGLIDRHEYSHMFNRWQQRHIHQNKPDFSDIDVDADGYITEDELIKTLNLQRRQQRRYRHRERYWSKEGY